MNTLPASDFLTDHRPHDDHQRHGRRPEPDLHAVRELRRQQERELAEASALLSTPATVLARRTIVVSVALLAATAVGADLAVAAALPPGWLLMAGATAVSAALVVLSCAVASLLGIRSRRVAARAVLQARDARLAHPQYHLRESAHTFLAA